MTKQLLDLRGTPCPINFIRSKIQLEKMNSGEILEIWLDSGEPIEQVPNSLKMENYDVESVNPQDDFFIVTVRR